MRNLQDADCNTQIVCKDDRRRLLPNEQSRKTGGCLDVRQRRVAGGDRRVVADKIGDRFDERALEKARRHGGAQLGERRECTLLRFGIFVGETCKHSAKFSHQIVRLNREQ